ncbi:MAG: FG-GAP-like repeat-containing protein [Syntrophobacteraceae bacterium]
MRAFNVQWMGFSKTSQGGSFRAIFVLLLTSFIILAPRGSSGAEIFGANPAEALGLFSGEPFASVVAKRTSKSASLLKNPVDQPVTVRRPLSSEALTPIAQSDLDASSPLIQGEPLELATADFDEDGTRDLVIAYGTATGGALTIQRGNVSALYPNSPRARAEKAGGTFSSSYFFPDAVLFDLPARPDFLGTGDFDADGHCDIVIASYGDSKLWWLPGNGHGSFGRPVATKIPGKATALVVGEMNRADGLEDVVLAVTGEDGPAILVFEGPTGARHATPERIALPAPANAIALGRFDADYSRDMAVAAGTGIVMVYGRDRKLSMDSTAWAGVGKPRIGVHPVGFSAIGIAAGNFHTAGEHTLSLLDEAGSVHFVDPRSLGESAPTLAAPSVFTADRGASAPRGRRLLVPTHSSSGRGDSVVVVDSPGSRLVVARGTEHDAAGPGRTQALELSSPPVAVLPLRLNVDALDDLVVLKADTKVPLAISETEGGPHFTVTTTELPDLDGCFVSPGPPDPSCYDLVCNKGPGGTCALDEALYECSFAEVYHGTTGCTVDFNVPGSGIPEVTTTYLAGAAMAGVLDPLTLDGSTQAAGRVRLSPAKINVDPNATIRNMVLRGLEAWDRNGPLFQYNPADNVQVLGSWFGVTDDGLEPDYRDSSFAMSFGSDCTIGGTSPEARNIILSEGQTVVTVYGHRNKIQGNYFGIAADGATALGGQNMLYLRDSTSDSLFPPDTVPPHDNVIGGTVSGARNLFFGEQYVLWLDTNTTSNLVQGNYFATDKDGATALGSHVAIRLQGKGNTVGGTTSAAGNLIAGTPGASSAQVGIQIDGLPDVTENLIIQGNNIGTDATGALALGKLYYDIEVTGGAKNITIGGAGGGRGNVIASANKGIFLDGHDNQPPSNITIIGNFIGTDRTGTIALPNGTGISVLASADNRIGGTTSGTRNIISGNSGSGISLSGYTENGTPGPPSTGNVVEGNYIGVASDGVTSLGNWTGVSVGSYATNNTIGALDSNASGAAASSNTIAYNQLNGVSISSDAGVGNRVTRNSIHSNGRLAIDLGFDGVTPNHATSPTVGPNLYQNAPVLADAETATGWSVKGTLHSIPNTTFQINFYSNCGLNAFGFAEGQTWLRAINVSTSSLGDAIFNQTFPVMDCSLFTATATDPDGNTSEMSIMGTGQQIGTSGGAIEYTDSQGLKTTVFIPEGGVASPLTFVYTEFNEPQHDLPGNLKPAGNSFALAAYNRFVRMNGYEFLEPSILTIKYSDIDVAGVDESKLKLYYWDGLQWVDAADTCTPASEYTLDVNANTISVPVCKVGDFVLAGPPVGITPIIKLLLLDD